MHSSSLEGSHPRAARETMSSSGSCTAQRTTRLQLLFSTRRAVEDLSDAVGRVRAANGVPHSALETPVIFTMCSTVPRLYSVSWQGAGDGANVEATREMCPFVRACADTEEISRMHERTRVSTRTTGEGPL